MDMAFQAFAVDDGPNPASRPAAPSSKRRETMRTIPTEATIYAPRRNPAAIAAVGLAHGAILYALIHFDVIAISRLAPQHLAVTMVEVAPPLPPHEQTRVAPPLKVETPTVAPPPIVALQAPPPQVIATPPSPDPVVAPPSPPAVAAVAAPAPGPIAVNILADVLDAPPPRFPAESRRLRESGTVRLRVVVSTEGRVADVTVARSSGFDRLDTAALEAVRKWRFRPRVVAGTATEAVGFVPVTFNPPH